MVDRSAVRWLQWTLLGVLVSRSAWGEGNQGHPGATQLLWVRDSASESCLSQGQLKAAIQRRLARDPFEGSPTQWIDGVVSRDGKAWAARIFERDAEGHTLGTRILRGEGENCRELDPGIVLAVTLMIDPDAALSEGEAVPSTASSTAVLPPLPKASSPDGAGDGTPGPAPIQPLRTALPPPALAPATRPRTEAVPTPTRPASGSSPRAEAVASGLLGGGWLPGTTLGAELGVTTWFNGATGLGRYAGFHLAALHIPEVHSSSSGTQLGFTLTAMSLGGCVRTKLAGQGWSAFGCLGLSVGGTTAIVYSPIPSGPGERLWGAGRGDAGIQVHLVGPIELRASALLLVPFPRWRFTIRGQEPAFQEPALLPAGELGLVLSFK